MKRSCLSLLALGGLMAVSLAPVTKADPLYKRTEVTFNQPVEIPGTVLTPGTYVLKLLDPYLHRDYVRFYNPQENHMYAMVRAIPDYRLTPTDHTVITFEERAHGAPQAIKEWFPAGDNWGEEFVYPQAETIAASVVPAAPQSLEPRPTAIAPVPVPEVKPVEKPAPTAQVQKREQPPAEIAQAEPAPASNPPAAAATEQPKALPQTASDWPAATLFGGALVLAGAILRRRTA
jgi:LPXTG-motif cell wall-anchored protein